MADNARCLRVVVFTGGATVADDCLDFIAGLQARPEVKVVGVFCESASPGFQGAVLDLWTRRRWLAPLLVMQLALRRIASSVTAPRSEIARRRTLRKLGDRIHFERDLHAPAVVARVAQLQPDLGAVYGGPILRPELFRIPAKGTLGIHHGRLPHYRGKKTTFWAMYNGEEYVGVAIQKIGEGLDRGDVLRDAVMPVRRMPLPIVQRRLHQLGLKLYVEAVLSVQQRACHFRPQPCGGGPLYKDPRAGDIARFWVRYLARLGRGTIARKSDG